MTKLKTKKGMLKRMKLTKNGKVKRYPPKKGHLRVEKSSKKRRALTKSVVIPGQIGRNIKALIGG